MRWIACLSLLAVAACGGATTEQNKAATKAASLAAGQWELTSEVTRFNTLDQGRPKIDTPAGTRATETVCIGTGRPPTETFTGAGYDCRYDSFYGRNGRVNATMLCSREGAPGHIPVTADGQFGADTLEYSRDLRTSFSGDGDVEITTRVTGRRLGDCPPEAAVGNGSAGNTQ